MKKSSFLIISLILILGTLGIGYSAWAQNLTVSGTVNTGYIKAEFSAATISPDAYAVSNWTITDSGAVVQGSNNPIADTLNVTISKAYPTFLGTVTFWVTNNGTVPFYMDNLDTSKIVVMDGIYAVTNIMQVPQPAAWNTTVIEPGANASFSFNIDIPGVKTPNFVDPDMNHTYTISVPLNAVQFELR